MYSLDQNARRVRRRVSYEYAVMSRLMWSHRGWLLAFVIHTCILQLAEDVGYCMWYCISRPADEPPKPVTPYITSFRSTLREVHQRIRQNTGTVAKTQKHYFDKYVRGSFFHVDQFVWLCWPIPPLRQQKRKLQRFWSGPWRIVEFQSSIIVVIQNLKTFKHQTIHVDRLAPCRSQEREQREPSDTGVQSALTDRSSCPEHQNSSQSKIRKSGRIRRPLFT